MTLNYRRGHLVFCRLAGASHVHCTNLSRLQSAALCFRTPQFGASGMWHVVSPAGQTGSREHTNQHTLWQTSAFISPLSGSSTRARRLGVALPFGRYPMTGNQLHYCELPVTVSPLFISFPFYPQQFSSVGYSYRQVGTLLDCKYQCKHRDRLSHGK